MQAWTAAAVGAPADVLTLGEREVPEPGPGEVRLRVAAAGLGLPDVLMCRGAYLFTPQAPFVPGQEVVGVVESAGPGSVHLPGERVMGVTGFYNGHGGLATYCLAPDFSLYPAPSDMPDAQAAAFTIAYHTAWVALQPRAQLQPGQTLLVHGGAGGSGNAALRLGKALGATVIAVAGGAAKVAFCRESGADHVIDHHAEDFVAAVNGLTEGRGADVVFDPVGGEIYARSVLCTASGGRLLAVGFAAGTWGQPDAGQLVLRNCAAVGVYVGAHGHDEMLAAHSQLCDLYREQRLQVAAPGIVPFAAAVEGLAALEARSALGKLVVFG